MIRMRRTVAELVDEDEPGWPLVQEWIDEAVVPVEVLPQSETWATEIEALQVTTRSPMGAIAHASGGLLVDGGWLKVLGASDPKLPWSISGLTRELGFWPDPEGPPPLLVVAVDVLGGVFAIDGGQLGAPGHVHYFAPDDPDWLDCDARYSAWLSASLGGGLDQFYADLRWDGCKEELAALQPDQGIHIYPPPWSEESKPLEKTSRRAISLLELIKSNFEARGS